MSRKIRPEDYRTVGDYIGIRRNFVEGLTVPMSALVDFDSIRYAWNINGGEFVKIADTIGNVIYLDVTGLSRAEILKDVARCILLDDELPGISPASIVMDIDKKREIARLFC